jgi:hypothetical protein
MGSPRGCVPPLCEGKRYANGGGVGGQTPQIRVLPTSKLTK